MCHNVIQTARAFIFTLVIKSKRIVIGYISVAFVIFVRFPAKSKSIFRVTAAIKLKKAVNRILRGWPVASVIKFVWVS